MLPTFFPVPIIDISHAIQIISFRIVQSFATLKKFIASLTEPARQEIFILYVGFVSRENNHKNFCYDKTIQNQYPQYFMNHINAIGHIPRISHSKEWLQIAELRFLAFMWSVIIFRAGLFLFRRHSHTYRENLSRLGLPPSPFLRFAS
ncbi:hypothetical protein AD948_12390 [Acetobacter senegalensis]|uniref:Uncharacterized protein n=1 Tax=Acetobacter senegalensis TaxID=446692 RepID=A0A149TYS1_9PROT|nr:hypothetical protein AD948_12390 [Acetobacter senegalensis]